MKSPEDFFQRAREKDLDINKVIINSNIIKKYIKLKTKKNYTRVLRL